jgi:hypothetical protein
MAANIGISAVIPHTQRIGWKVNFIAAIEISIKMAASAVTIFDFRRDKLNERIHTSPGGATRQAQISENIRRDFDLVHGH